MLRHLFQGLLAALPSQCLVCHAWPAQPVCEACVQRFAQPQIRCPTCALLMPVGVPRCGICLTHPPPLDAADLVLPMPLSPQRLQTRGFNQALVLARHLAPDKTDPQLLLRIKDTPPQRTLKRNERLTSVQDAFAVDPLRHTQVKGARVVLVDDVMTSGASLFAAAQALRSAGAAHITGVVLARTDRPH